MRFKDITIRGFEGIGMEPGIELTGLQDRNIFIGPNNVGKSSFFRCMHFLQASLQNVHESSRDYRDLFIPISVPDSIWCKQQIGNDIGISISLYGAPGFSLVNQMCLSQYGELCLDMYIVHDWNGEPAKVIVAPRMFISGDDRPIPLLKRTAPSQFHCYDARSGYISSFENMNLVAGQVISTLPPFFRNQRFFDPVRTILKPTVSRASFVDGAELLPNIHAMQEDSNQSRSFHSLRTRILSTVNGLLESSGTLGFDNFEIKKQGNALPDLVFYQGSEIISASKMGTGISELFFICASLIMDEGNEMIYYLEEPETHLHPGLLRRMYRLFSSHKNIQFMINTHSHVLLDDIADGDRIYLWSRNSLTHESSARPCQEIMDHHQVLDDLGIRASSLLQTNCVIWVEGPSDRIYVKRWLHEIGRDRNAQLIDGSDYTVVIYGGALLANYELDDSAEDHFVSMIRLSRFAVVLMDRDFAPGDPSGQLKPRVRRIVDDAASDPQRRLALITIGREIENDLSRAVFLDAARTILATLEPREELFTDDAITGAKNYFDELAEHLFPGQKDLMGKAKNCLSRKVRFAEAVIDCCDEATKSYPDYAVEIYEHILKSRLGF